MGRPNWFHTPPPHVNTDSTHYRQHTLHTAHTTDSTHYRQHTLQTAHNTDSTHYRQHTLPCVCVCVCVCVCLSVCVISTAQTDRPILMKLSTNHLLCICSIHFSPILKIQI